MPSWFHISHLFLTLILGTYFFFGLHHLSQFITADEHYWISERIPQYWNAIANHQWKKTFINDKPGVSLALISGTSTVLYPESENHCKENADRLKVCAVSESAALYLGFRLPILITNGLLLLLLFFLISKLTNPWIALWTTLLGALSPILLGISQIVNPDSLLWSFGATALFAFLVFLETKEKKFLFLTIGLTGLAILTKYTALILLPFYLALIVFRHLFGKEEDRELLSRGLRQELRAWLVIAAGALALLCFFLPALLFDSKYLAAFIMTVPDKKLLALLGGGLLLFLIFDTWILENRWLFFTRRLAKQWPRLLALFPILFLTTFGGIIIARNFFPDWSIFSLITFDLKDLSNARYYTTVPNFFEAYLLEWNPLVFSLTPITLLGFGLLLFGLFRKNKPEYALQSYELLFFFLLYTVLLIYSNILTTARYSVLLYPLFAFLAALGFWQLCHYPEHTKGLRMKYAITGILLLASLWSLTASSPFYFNYTNTFLPKSSLIHDAWGYGGYEAAQYLNSLPNAKELTVWADYYGVCEFFVGKCLTAYTFDQNVVSPDYYTLTRRGKARYLSRHPRWERLSGLTAYRYYGTTHPDWQLLIGDRPGNFIKVVKVEKNH